ncbi:MAG: mandelate racemase/muconate lactonizing enzyme family protein [Acidobacteriota bacterium]
MRIVSARLRPIGGPVPAGIRNRALGWQARHGVLLALVDETGTVGQGEASPLPGYSPDLLEECVTALEAVVARVPIAIDLAGDGLARIAAVTAELPPELPAARMAVETALLDLAAKRLGTSVAALLAGRRLDREVPVSMVLLGADVAALEGQVRAGLAVGVHTFKLKVGGPDFAAELALIGALRAAVPGGWALRLDANGAWPLDVAGRHLEAMAGLAVEFVEQPVAAELLPELTGSPVALAADETMRLPGALARLAATRACAAVVLKPMVLGGLGCCLSLAREARRAGLGVIVTHLFDGPVALAAACELALAVQTPLACGLAPHPALAAFGGQRPAALRPDRIVPHDLPGLGLAGAQ